MARKPQPEENVFLNYPYDDSYRRQLLPALVFVVHECGYYARSAADTEDGEARLRKIERMIASCRQALHDFSRDNRHNLSFECGLCYGRMWYVTRRKQRTLRVQVMAASPGDIDKKCSDLRGVDTLAHGDDPELLIRVTRDWLEHDPAKRHIIPSAPYALDRYRQFAGWLRDEETRRGVNPGQFSFPVLRELTAKWIGTIPRT